MKGEVLTIELTRLVPPPRVLFQLQGTCSLSRELVAKIDGYRIGSPLPPEIKTSVHEGGAETGRYDHYTIVVDTRGIKVTCLDERGLLYAMQRLAQIVEQFPELTIPCFRCDDWADLPVRAVMLDVSRDRVPTMKTLLRMIDFWAALKFNQLQLYMEHTFAYRGHEGVWQEASPFTPEQICTVDQYCAQLGMELVPNQNSFGHMERWLQHPAYRHLGETPEGFTDPWGVFRPSASTLDPRGKQVTELLGDLFDQLLPNFSSNLFNVGGDEPWELGTGKSREAAAREGVDRLYLEFLLKLYGLTEQRKVRMMVWADIIMKYPHIVRELPKDIILVDWGYEAEHPFEEEAQTLAESGFDFYLCVGTSSWNSIGGRWNNARTNIIQGASAALRHGAAGFMVTEWGDNGHMQQLPIALPAFIYAASAAWNYELLDQIQIEKVLPVVFPEISGCQEALMIIEQVGESSGIHLHNASLPGALLFDHLAPYYREEITNQRGYLFKREFALLDMADSLISGDSLVAQELGLTVALLKFACTLGVLRLATPGCSVVEIPPVERVMLADRLGDIIVEYRRLWLERSREGGLAESAGRLEELRELLLSEEFPGTD
ncbi:MAG: beta-N-acetylhexosaminidase [Spirochaetota bacterium]